MFGKPSEPRKLYGEEEAQVDKLAEYQAAVRNHNYLSERRKAAELVVKEFLLHEQAARTRKTNAAKGIKAIVGD